MSNPLVTVVVPAFNRGECLAAAVSSIQQQTWSNLEVAIIDDGSTDATSHVANRLSHDDHRVRVIRHVRNLGAQAARNTGIENARGSWVAFLDSDDTWVPHSLEVRLKCALENRVAVVHSTCDVIEADGTTRPFNVRPLAGRVYTELLQSEGPLFPTLLIARDALRKIGGLDHRIIAFQEWDTAISLAKHYEFGFVAEPTFIWDCRRTDTMSKNMLRGAIGYEQVFHKRYFDILRYAGADALANHYFTAARWYAAADESRNAARCKTMGRLWSCLDLKRLPGKVGRRLIGHAP
jgi:glycosyltransferase involved in cell wall biosynthesis